GRRRLHPGQRTHHDRRNGHDRRDHHDRDDQREQGPTAAGAARLAARARIVHVSGSSGFPPDRQGPTGTRCGSRRSPFGYPPAKPRGKGSQMPTTVERQYVEQFIAEERGVVAEVLPREEYQWAHIRGAVHLPLAELTPALAARHLTPDRPV